MELLVEAAKQVPALAVLAWLVYYMNSSQARQQEASEKRLEKLVEDIGNKYKDLHDRTETARQSTQDTLMANTNALGGIAVLLDRVKRDIRGSKRDPKP